jgi:hypothetical protein
MCKCGSFFENCLCYTCKNKGKRTEYYDCDICESGDMCVFACNQYEKEEENENE